MEPPIRPYTLEYYIKYSIILNYPVERKKRRCVKKEAIYSTYLGD